MSGELCDLCACHQFQFVAQDDTKQRKLKLKTFNTLSILGKIVH